MKKENTVGVTLRIEINLWEKVKTKAIRNRRSAAAELNCILEELFSNGSRHLASPPEDDDEEEEEETTDHPPCPQCGRTPTWYGALPFCNFGCKRAFAERDGPRAAARPDQGDHE